MSLKRDVAKVYASEGYHPVYVHKKSKRCLAGQALQIENRGSGCALDDVVEPDSYASLQTRGLVSVVLSGLDDAAVHAGAMIYATTNSGNLYLSVNRPAGVAGFDVQSKAAVRPWGIVLQRGKRSINGETTVRAFKFPGPNTVLEID